MLPQAYFQRYGLVVGAITAASSGTANKVYLTDNYVLRVGPAGSTHHPRKARLALAALARGVRTAAPLFWSGDHSIWARLPGHDAHAEGRVQPGVWAELLHDLQTLHSGPLEPRPSTWAPTWRGRPNLVGQTQEQARWTSQEHQQLLSWLGTPVPISAPAFVHGDAFGANVIVDTAGRYSGLIDWGCAAWQSLEAECARLEPAALSLALATWTDRVDRALIFRMRLDLLLEVALAGRVSWTVVRRCMAQLT